METINVQQGSPEWHAIRAEKFTASEAPAMMGDSKYQSRDELLHMKKTGETKEVTPFMQKIFDKGHATEEAARPLVEEIIGEELFPAVGIEGQLLASFDGIDMLETIVFEHKMYNKDLAADVKAGKLSPHYQWQLEQQLLVSGAEKAIFVTSDGTKDNFEYMYYEPSRRMQDELLKGWAQFKTDLESYVAPEKAEAVEPEPVMALPSITYKMDGLALTSNMPVFKAAANELVERSKLPISSDQDFANRETLIKGFKKAEALIKEKQEQVIGEISDVDEFRKDLAYIGEQIRQARLAGEKLVDKRKKELRYDIAMNASGELAQFVADLEKEIKPIELSTFTTDFASVMKGKKKLDSVQSAVNDELARLKIEFTSKAGVVKTNLSALEAHAEHRFLFNDLKQIIHTEPDHFALLADKRVSDYLAEEARKAEEKRIASETAAKQKSEVVETDSPAPATAKHPVQKPRVKATGSAQPSDQEIIEAIASHFGVHADEATQWLSNMNFNKTTEACLLYTSDAADG